jgi:hypothetical protein
MDESPASKPWSVALNVRPEARRETTLPALNNALCPEVFVV